MQPRRLITRGSVDRLILSNQRIGSFYRQLIIEDVGHIFDYQAKQIIQWLRRYAYVKKQLGFNKDPSLRNIINAIDPNSNYRAFKGVYTNLTSTFSKSVKGGFENFIQVADPEATLFIQEPGLQTFDDLAKRRIRKIAPDINKATSRMIRRQILSSPANIENSIQFIQQKIGGNFGRAARIARTEQSTLLNRGVLLAFEQSDIVNRKEWITSGPNTCGWCQPLSGKIISLGSSFYPSGTKLGDGEGHTITTYDDITGPPLHPNCECTLAPVS